MEPSRNTIQKRKIWSVKGLFPGLSYVENDSLLHRVHPLIKLAWLICFSLTVFALSSWIGEVLLFGTLLLCYFLAGLGLFSFARKLRFILVFGLMILLIQILAVKEGYLIWQYSRGTVNLMVWSEGLLGGVSIMFRFINIIGSSYLFVAVTDPNRLAYTLMQMGLPYRFGFMLITALRFIPVFQLELEQVKNAQMAKGIEIEGLSPRQLLRTVKYLFVPLVISSLSKVDSLAISMESRAFGLYPTRTYMHHQALSRYDKAALIIIPLAFLIFCLVFR